MNACRACGEPLAPSRGPRERKWCNETCRRRGQAPVLGPVAAGAVEVAVVARCEAWPDAVLRAVAVALARVVDQSGPSTVSAARELRTLLEGMGSREVSIIDQLQTRRAARRAAALGVGAPRGE